MFYSNSELCWRDQMEMYHLKNQVDSLHPTLKICNDARPVRWFSFLEFLCDIMDKTVNFEAASENLLA